MVTFKVRALALSVTAALASFAMLPAAHADTISLLASGTHSFSANTTNTTFSLTDIQPAGSGVFNPFVRIQASGQEQGYNTSDTKDTLDDTSNGPANPLITMNTVVDQNKQINLALDYNEPGSSASTINLENLTLVVSTNPNKFGPTAPSSFTIKTIPADAGDVTLYNMASTTRTDAGHVGNSFDILMDAKDNLASGNGGSGQADLLVRIDLSSVNLSGLLDANHYLYVYSRFNNSDAGFEEWSLQTPSNPLSGGGNTPEPASLGILGVGALALIRRRRA